MQQAQASLDHAPALVSRADHDRITFLTLDRPANRNALSRAMLLALQEEFTSIAADRGLRAVVLAGNGPVFSAGHDLKEMTAARAAPDKGRAFFEETMALCAA